MKPTYILSLSGAALFILLNTYIKRRTTKMTTNNIQEVIKATRKPMTTAEKEELVTRVKAMDPEELELIMDTIPLEMCLNRIKKEIDRVNNFQASLDEAMAIMGKKFI